MSTNNNKNSIHNSSINAGGNIHIGDVINNHLQPPHTNAETDPKPFTKEVAIEVKNFIGQGRIEKAIDLLLEYAKHSEPQTFNEIIQYARQWEELQRDTRIGVLSTDEKFRLASRVTYGVLETTDALVKSN